MKLSGKSMALMTIASRTGGRVALGATISPSPTSRMVRGPITVRLEPCGAATARLVDPDGKPVAGRIYATSRITMVVTPGPPSIAPGRPRLLSADEADLNDV